MCPHVAKNMLSIVIGFWIPKTPATHPGVTQTNLKALKAVKMLASRIRTALLDCRRNFCIALQTFTCDQVLLCNLFFAYNTHNTKQERISMH